MDTPDLLMSSQQQAAGAEQRRPGGFQTGDLGCPDGVSCPFTPVGKKGIVFLCTGKVMVEPSAQMCWAFNLWLSWMTKIKNKTNLVTFQSKTFVNSHISGLGETGVRRYCLSAIITETKVRTGRKMGESRGSQEGVGAQIRFHALSLFIEL